MTKRFIALLLALSMLFLCSCTMTAGTDLNTDNPARKKIVVEPEPAEDTSSTESEDALPTEDDNVLEPEPVENPDEAEINEGPVEDAPEAIEPPEENSDPDPEPEPVEESDPEPELPSVPDEQQPPTLLKTLQKADMSFSDLGCEQLVLVISDGNYAVVHCYECTDGLWKLADNLGYMNGHVGKNGVNRNRTQGDYTSPYGLYNLGFAFGNKSDPGTALEYRDVNEYIYWVGDPDSDYYNQWVDSRETGGVTWSEAEHLKDYPNSYAYSIVIEYNMPEPVRNAGYAIFFHCGSGYTQGCVSISENNMVNVLKWIQPGAKILIT